MGAIFVIFILFCVLGFIAFLNDVTLDIFVFLLMGIGILILCFAIDYINTISEERDIPIQFELLSQEGDVIEGFSQNLIIKSDKAISIENNNQASSFIVKKSEWVDEVKRHNKEILKYIWRYELNGFIRYMGFGLTPFDNKEELKKYIIEIK